MKTCLTMTVVILLCLGSGFSKGVETTDIVEMFDSGFINWTQGIFVSKGTGSPPAKTSESTANDHDIILNDSRNHALKNMLSIMLATRIRANILARDVAVKNEMIMAQIESLAKGVKPVKREYMSDGTVEITMQMNMFGGFSQLILPEEIKQIEPIKTVSREEASSTEAGASSSPESKSEIYTGLVVDARGTQFKPAMAPVIVDENGKEVYGGAFVSREFAVQKGMCKYLRDVKAAQTDATVANHPLTVKGLRVDNGILSNIVISNADAMKIRSTSEHLSFLKQCRVIIVMD
jgi:hypothetical protein